MYKRQTWFNNPYAAQKLELGQEYYFKGIVTGGMLRRQMVNPQVRTDAQVKSSPFEAVYPQTEGLTSSCLLYTSLGQVVEDLAAAGLAVLLCHVGQFLHDNFADAGRLCEDVVQRCV